MKPFLLAAVAVLFSGASPALGQESSQQAWDRSSLEAEAEVGKALGGTSGQAAPLSAPPVVAPRDSPWKHLGLHGPRGSKDCDSVSLIEKPGALGHGVNLLTAPIGAAKLHWNAIGEGKGFWAKAARVAAVCAYPFTLLAAVGMNAVGMLDEIFSAIGAALK